MIRIASRNCLNTRHHFNRLNYCTYWQEYGVNIKTYFSFSIRSAIEKWNRETGKVTRYICTCVLSAVSAPAGGVLLNLLLFSFPTKNISFFTPSLYPSVLPVLPRREIRLPDRQREFVVCRGDWSKYSFGAGSWMEPSESSPAGEFQVLLPVLSVALTSGIFTGLFLIEQTYPMKCFPLFNSHSFTCISYWTQSTLFAGCIIRD
jgi:hypothetical protein